MRNRTFYRGTDGGVVHCNVDKLEYFTYKAKANQKKSVTIVANCDKNIAQIQIVTGTNCTLNLHFAESFCLYSIVWVRYVTVRNLRAICF